VSFPCCFEDGSCTDMPTGHEFVCEGAGGYAFDEGQLCSEVDCDAILGACCLSWDTCKEIDVFDCATLGGTFMGFGEVCDEVECPEIGCRTKKDDLYRTGDKQYNIDECQPVVMALAQRPTEHRDEETEAPEGSFEPVTAYETRSTYREPKYDQCRLHYGTLWLFPDGTVRPVLCSQPTNNADSQRINVGFFGIFPAATPDGVVQAGQVAAVVGSENPRNVQVTFRSEPLLCRGVLE